MAINSTLSEPKRHVIAFVKTATDETPYRFKTDGPELEARNFVHRMRVELSRMREQVKQRGRVPSAFKMLLLGIEENPDGSCMVILGKKNPPAICEELNEALDALDGGAPL